MLQQLSIHNFALIDTLKLNLNDGFTVITGETGSGKSILLGALKLILGERADYSVIRDTEKKTIVEALFKLPSKEYASFFKENDLDFEEETIIRREINASGKSRTFINDTPVQLTLLKELAERLVHIHSQHHTLELKNKNFQRFILDTVSENDELLSQLTSLFQYSKSLEKEIEALKERKSKQELEADFNAFQLEELTQLNLQDLDYSEIQNEVERGEQFEEVKAAYQLIASTINDDNGVYSLLNRIKSLIKVSDSKIDELVERIQSVSIELKDIGSIAEDDLSELSYEPEELARFVSLLDAFNSALRKHNLHSQADLLGLYTQLSSEVGENSQIDEKINEKAEELKKTVVEANSLAKKISKNRQNTAKDIEKQVSEMLVQLKLEGAKIHFQFENKALSENGIDEITLFFAPNKGLAPQPIEKAASGGELSRLMLTIQFLLSQKKKLPTVIFDEIDTGVSGEVAQKIGEHLKKMGQRMQLMAITHLPQVASKGNSHFVVSKQEEQGIVTTRISELTEEERVEEIAKLMSGSKINEAALLNAKNLMNE